MAGTSSTLNVEGDRGSVAVRSARVEGSGACCQKRSAGSNVASCECDDADGKNCQIHWIT
jgi:hypothetical protein